MIDFMPEPFSKRAAGFLGLKRDIVLLLGMSILVGLGERLGSRYIPKYLEFLGAGAIAIGIYGTVENLFGALWSLPGGFLTDRLGARRALAIFNLISICGYLIVILAPSWPAVIMASILFLSWSSLSLPATMDIIARRLPQSKRAMGVSMHSIIRRIPMAAGPVLGGILIGAYGMQNGIKMAFSAAVALALGALILQQKMVLEEKAAYEKLKLLKIIGRFDPALKNLLVSDILIRFCEQIPNSFVVIWVMNVAGKGAFQFGWLTAIEMGTAMLLYIPVASFSDRAERKPFVIATFVFFTLFPAILFFSTSTSMLILAFMVRGLKEFGEPTRKALIVDLADQRMKARTVGAYYFLRDTIVSAGAFLGGWLWSISPALNLWTAFAFGIIGTAYFAVFGRSAAKKTS